jgi:hypothetical protein
MTQVPQIPGDVSQTDLINASNNAVRELNARDVTQVFKDDTGTRRVLIGKGEGFHGIKVSQTGSDVFTAEDNELVMSSDFNTFKIVQTGELDVAMPSVSQVGAGADENSNGYTVAHNLGYVPIFIAYLGVITETNYKPIPYTEVDLSTGTSILNKLVAATSDETNLYFTLKHQVLVLTGSHNAGGWDGTIKYYIIRETAN